MDDIVGFIFGSIVFVLVIGIIFATTVLQCHWRWKPSGLDYKWRPISGCMVHSQNRWWPSHTIVVPEK